MKHAFRGIVATLSLIALCLLSVTAQVTTADVVGTVTDATGAVLANARVGVTNLGTGQIRTAQTNSSGDYVINSLQPGTYSVKVEAPSFKTFRVATLTLASGDRTRVDASMQPGQTSETIEVTASTPLLQTDSSTLSSTVTSQAVQDLPLNGRNFVQLAQQVPGANEGPPAGLTSGARPDDRRQTSALSVNGQSDVINNEMVDGMDNNERIIGGIGVRPSVDAIAEFRVETNDYTAEVGRTAGGVVNVITKAGTNSFHGSLYEYFRNDKFDAHSFFDKAGTAKPELRQNQYGGSIGGPVIKDKTFFFGDYEGFRLVSGQASQVLTVPTLFEEQNPGNFTDRGGPIITTIDPVGLEYFQMFPAPNTGAVGATSGNYTSPALTKTQFSHTFDVRVDQHINDKNLFFARYTYNNVSTFFPGAFPTTTVNGVTVNPNGLFFGFAGQAPDKAQQLQLNYTHFFNTSLLLELKAGYLRTNNASFPLNFGTNASQKLGMPGVNTSALDSGLSQVTFDTGGVAPLGDDQFVPISDIDNTYQYSGMITYTRGRHNMKYGATLIRRLATEGQSNSGVGTWAFPDLPSLLVGTSRVTTRINELNVPHYRFWEPSVFVQDDWRAKNWLTLNLGVRYDVFTPLVEEKNRIANFDPVAGAIIIPGQNGVSRSGGVKTDWSNIAPRIGFAATLGHGTVLRGGYGISYVPENYTSNVTQKDPPFISVFVYNNSRALSQGLQPPAPASATSPASIPDAVALNFRSTSLQQFNLTLQKDFSGNVLTVGYVGMLGRHLAVNLNDLDYVTPGPAATACLSLAAPLRAGCLAPLRPYATQLPSLTGNIGQEATIGNSSYHALQASFERRFKAGLTFNANYTWAHGIDDVRGLSNQGGDGLGVIPSQLSTYDRGNSDLDIRHRVVATANYALPFGHSLSGVEGGIVKGWQVNFIDVWETSVPFSILNPGSGRSGAKFFGGTDRPNQIGNPNLSTPSVSGFWFNPNAFVGQPLGTIGNVRKNSLYGPHFRHFDFSVFKDFKLTEGKTLQFRSEFFNLTNTPSFANPSGGSVNAPAPGGALGNFGKITAVSQNYTPRQIQFVLKFLF